MSPVYGVAAPAALTQGLVHVGQRRLDRGETLVRLQPWYVRENKWRAARYGLDARVIVDQEGTQVPLREDIERVIAELAPVAESLGCSAELAQVGAILTSGSSAERQLKTAQGFADPTGAEALGAVVHGLADAFRAGIAR